MKKFLSIFLLLILFSMTLYSIEYVTLSSELTENLSGRVSIPFFYGTKDAPSAFLLNSYLAKDVEDFLSEYLDESYSFRNSIEDSKGPYVEVIIESEVGFDSDSFVSFYADYFSFVYLQAHPMTTRETYNYDLTLSKFLNLYDFLDLYSNDTGESFQIIKETIIEEINSDPKIYFNVDETLDTIGYDRDYYVTNEDLVIIYQLYEIAPYSSGIREFKIPLKELGIEIQ
ncbi:RsiV family protein [Petrotoga halophila]|uniref:RsiV family protein n=1 Tax=Petrotoga halophila TaxID=301141 RepID=UPI000CDE6350|nr:RsiV family protein [Petrotoga halophila]